MASYNSLESPGKLFAHSRNSYQLPTTIPKRSIQREFSFKSPQRYRLDFEAPQHRSKDAYEVKYLEKGRKVVELQHNIEAILRNNRQLADQNQEMKTMLLMQRNEIESLRIKGSRAMDLILTQELDNKNFEHRVQVQKLLTEITRLQNQIINLETSKNIEIQVIRDELQKMNMVNMTSIKRSQAGMTEAYQIQIKRLGDVILFKEDEIARVMITNRREKQILLDELTAVKSQFKHMLALKNNEINQLKFAFESDIARMDREYRQKEQTQGQAHDVVLRRLNKQLSERLGEVERLTDQIRNNNSQYDELFKQLDTEKRKYQQEMDTQMDDTRQKIKHEKQRMENIISRTIENLTTSHDNKVKGLEGEITLLKDLLSNRRSDLESQRQSMRIQRDSYKIAIDDLESQNKNLREKLNQINRQNLSSIEALKIKIAQLHEADINGLAKIHEVRITSLSQQLAEKNRQLDEMRKRLHAEMQGKLHLRKEYQIVVARLKSNIMDMRIQINAVQIEMKDNITSMRSQLDVTSQGLIKDRQSKARTIKSFEDQMRKLRQTIQGKDQELGLVEENANKKVELYKSEVQVLNERNNNLKKQLEERENRKGKQIQARDEEISRLRIQLEDLKQQLREDQQLRKKKIKEMNDKNDYIEDHLNKANKEIKNLKDKITSYEHDINLARGDVETVRFQQQAAANQERTKHHESISKTHSGFKEYYEKRIKQLEKDKLELAGINTTQSEQINELVTKYKQLEDALKALLDSQKRLSDLQNKIIHMGMDNNLIKNLAELIKRPYN